MATLPKAYALFETTLQDSITSAGTSMTLVTGTDKEGTNLARTIGYIIDEGTASEEFVIVLQQQLPLHQWLEEFHLLMVLLK